MTSRRPARVLREVIRPGQRMSLDHLMRGELRADLLEPASSRPRIEANPGLRWRLRRGAESLEER